MKIITLFSFAILISSCNNATKEDHGYNELANPEGKKSIITSDYNTDNDKIANIERPEKPLIKTALDTTLLFNVWTTDPKGPHADFDFTSKSFFVVDYDGDGDMPFQLNGNNLTVYYNDFIQEGEIIMVSKDSLKIKWKDVDQITGYTQWEE